VDPDDQLPLLDLAGAVEVTVGLLEEGETQGLRITIAKLGHMERFIS